MRARFFVLVTVILVVLAGGIVAADAVSAQEGNETVDDGPQIGDGTPDDSEGSGDGENNGSNSDSEDENPPSEGNETEASDPLSDYKYTVEELRRGGTTPPGESPESVRDLGGKYVWLVHWPASTPWVDVGNDENWKHLMPGETVGRNSVYLKSVLPNEGETLTMKVVYWNEGQKTFSLGDGQTTTETVPTNIREETVEVELNKGFPQKKISLPEHNETTQVTMWVEGHEDDARWHFQHRTIETSKTMQINTVGEYLTHSVKDFLGPLLIGVFIVGGGVRAALRRAGSGPQWGLFAWIIMLLIATFLIVFFAFESTANLLAGAPTLISLFLVALFGVVMLESYEFNITKVLLEKHEVKPWVTPSGEEGVGMLSEEDETFKIVDLQNGEKAVVKSGIMPFLARAFGYTATIENMGEIKSRVDLSDSSIASEKWYIDADSDELLDYEQEGWEISLPELSLDNAGEILLKVAALLVGCSIAWTAPGIWGYIACGLVAGLVLLRPTDGYARINPAPSHYHDAHANQVQRNTEYDHLKTMDEAKEAYWASQAHNERDVQDEVDKKDKTLVETMFGAEDDDRSIIGKRRDRDRHDGNDEDEDSEGVE